MDRLIELEEARDAAVDVLDQIDSAADTLGKAKFWGN
ncbi:Uncharacterised protein [Alloiococcus otitis]|uniref:Uncharacterized protein n=1 Tax=Alloiococcus otitis ATCC 51267 TaxID=883081 RepID=K9E9L8_9LACT|nr:hypothetical protein HMPREF9698_00556 [Alloiococcus otitis ATCC 51267]SUU81679.1 Uncharacterised protein [Alloiococcus otitis]